MTRRSRSLAYGGAGALIAAGVLCAALITGGVGPLLAIVLVGLGLISVLSLIFLEVGLSEDRWRAREDRSRQPAAAEPEGGRPRRPAGSPPARAPARRPVKRLDRRRGGRRRLR